MHTVDPKKKKVGATQLFQTQRNTCAVRTEVQKATMLSDAGEFLPCLVGGLPSPDQTRKNLWESGTGSWWAKAEGHWELLLYRNLLTERDEKCELTGVSYSSTQGHPPPSSNAQNFLNQSGEPQTFEMLLAWWRDRLSLAGIQDFTVRVMAVLKW